METLTFAVIAIIYIGIFLVGALAQKISKQKESTESFLVGNRKLSFGVGLCTMTATWVGGGYICGTAEAVFSSGLVWTQAPWGYGLSLIIGGIFFAGIMRNRGYVTLLDPFQERYGHKVTALLYIPALFGEIFWSAAILAALGYTVSSVLNIDVSTAIITSAAVAVLYTVMGGLMAVAYTDVIQLIMILLGLCLTLPFAITSAGGWDLVITRYFELSPASTINSMKAEDFALGKWLDMSLLLIFGGIPWGVYFQRVLACPNAKRAKILSIWSGLGCIILAIPPIILGMVGKSADWAALGLEIPQGAMILPAVIKYLTPNSVGIIGAAVITAAVMSSIDSSILSASSMFVWNIVRPFDKRKKWPLKLILKISMIIIGALATTLALKANSVYTLWYLCADLVYVLLFPQLLAVLFFKYVNQKGAVLALGVGLSLRLLFGEENLGIPAIAPEFLHSWPYRTISMICSISCLHLVSKLTRGKEVVQTIKKKLQSQQAITSA